LAEFKFPYTPREQALPLHNRTERWGVMVCHRRWGKSVGCVGELILRAIYTKKKNAEFAYVGPFRQQAKKIAWSYLKEYTEGIRKGPPRESDLCVTLINGSKITIYGADNPDTIRGLFFDGVVIDEFGDCRPSLWKDVIYPTLMDRKGWAVFIGTPKGKNHFYKMLQRSKSEPNWFSMTMKASESGVFNEQELLDAKREMGEDAYEREMECSFDASVPGTYYTKIMAEIEKTTDNFGSYRYNPDLPVHVAADLGRTDSTVMWFWQIDEKGPVMIDCEDHSGQDLDFYFKLLDSKGYDYGTIWVPHDAVAKTLATKRSTIEQFLEHFKKDKSVAVRVVPRLSRQHGIDASRLMLYKTRFDIEKCMNGVEGLRAYRRQYNEKTEAFADEPYHDWASDFADAFRYYALVTDSKFVPEETVEKKVAPDALTLDNLYKDRDNGWKSSIIRL
jgi:phage terminase large subunit